MSFRLRCRWALVVLLFVSVVFGSARLFADDDSEESSDSKGFAVKKNIEDVDQKIKDLAKFLQEEKFPQRFLKVEAGFDKEADKVVEGGTVFLKTVIKYSVRTAEYYEFLDRMRPLVEALAYRRIRWTQEGLETSRSQGITVTCVHYEYAPSYDPRYCYIALPSGRPNKFEKVRWDVYSVPLKVQALLGVLAYEQRSIDLALVDSDNKIVFRSPLEAPLRAFDKMYLHTTLCYDFYETERDSLFSLESSFTKFDEAANPKYGEKSLEQLSENHSYDVIRFSVKDRKNFYFLPAYFWQPEPYGHAYKEFSIISNVFAKTFDLKVPVAVYAPKLELKVKFKKEGRLEELLYKNIDKILKLYGGYVLENDSDD